MYSENFISKKLRTFAENNEWLVSGEYIYGEEQGFLFSGLDGKGEKTFITPVPGITEEQQNDLFEILEKNKSTMKLTDYTVTDDFLCIRIKDSMQLKLDDIDFILALLVGTLQELNIDTVGRCQECGKSGAETEDFVFDLYCYMHSECAIAYKEAVEKEENELDEENDSDDDYKSDSDEVDSDSDENLDDNSDEDSDRDDDSFSNEPVSMVRKVLFTVGGAVLGSIPWLLLPYVMDFVNDLIGKITTNTLVVNFTQSLFTCICAYLISYLAIIGYRLSKAKMDIKGRWIVGIVSILIVLVVQLLSLVILIAKEPSVSLTFANYLTNITKSNFYINMLLGALIGIVFTLIAVLPFFDNSISSEKARKDYLSKRKSSKSDSGQEDLEDVNMSSEELLSDAENNETAKNVDVVGSMNDSASVEYTNETSDAEILTTEVLDTKENSAEVTNKEN